MWEIHPDAAEIIFDALRNALTREGPLVQENMIKSLAERRKDEFAQALAIVIYRALYETYSWLTIKAAMRPERDIGG